MPSTIIRFAPEGLSSTEIAKALADERPASYKIAYFGILGLGAVPRDILAFGCANWENVVVTEWPLEAQTLFGVLPMLHITTADGIEVKLAESIIIEHYLAKRFGLLGDNEWEEQQIKMFHSSSLYLRERLSSRVTWNFKDKMEQAFQTFITATLPQWIEAHSKHLKDNGSNGHYVGNKLSLADIQTANIIDHFACLKQGDEIVAKIKESDEIWRVKERVDTDPRLREWRASEGYKKLVATSQVMYANTGL
ncbi:hypothetical protein EDD11_000691 [Mortierella claussenii]|nr:hypothetical protein EDD11_000691 [Mortierella claussenii]